ncbi:hypothetical protein QJS10_CPB19g01999 [Acorus calamus]|uniref:Uncharacterized protein n=1 Tax=Acorus calamus TaxID=4465 RepID=A0AAV9CHR5_ACOCL|nr:hypothetical protein QJS10_CPB19g01999 [Acorus calamus]
MLKREALRFVSHLHRGRKTMALYKGLFCSGFSGMTQIGRMSDRSSQIPRRGWIDVGGVYSVNHCSGNDGLSLKCCASESFDGVLGKFDGDSWKPRALASHHQLIRDSESGTGGEEFGQKIVNGKTRHGSPLRFLDSPMPEKLVVAVDVDEGLLEHKF